MKLYCAIWPPLTCRLPDLRLLKLGALPSGAVGARCWRKWWRWKTHEKTKCHVNIMLLMVVVMNDEDWCAPWPRTYPQYVTRRNWSHLERRHLEMRQPMGSNRTHQLKAASRLKMFVFWDPLNPQTFKSYAMSQAFPTILDHLGTQVHDFTANRKGPLWRNLAVTWDDGTTMEECLKRINPHCKTQNWLKLDNTNSANNICQSDANQIPSTNMKALISWSASNFNSWPFTSQNLSAILWPLLLLQLPLLKTNRPGTYHYDEGCPKDLIRSKS